MQKERLKTWIKVLKTTYWIFLAATAVVFYYSLRQSESGFIATLIALGGWGLIYLVNLIMKKVQKKYDEAQ